MMALTRLPSGKRASTIGDVSSTRRPTFDTMRSMICSRWSLSRNLTSRLLHLAAALDVDLVRPVDEDVADRRVLEQHLQRAEAERLVEHLVDEPLALHAVEQRVFGVAQALDDQADLAAERVALQVADARQVELVDQLAVDEPLELLEALVVLPVRADLTAAEPAEPRAVAAELPLRPRCKRDMGAILRGVSRSVVTCCKVTRCVLSAYA